MTSLTHALAGPLRIFATVAQTEHVSEAADVLGLPQSTVTRTIQRLESVAQVALFDRLGRGLRLTTVGRSLAQELEPLASMIDAASQRFVEDADGEAGLVRCAFLHSLGSPQMPLLVSSFKRDFPDARFDLRQNSHRLCTNMLLDGEVDLALLAPPPQHEKLESQVLYSQPLHLAVPSGHRLAGRASVFVAELEADQFISFAPGIGLREYTFDLAAACGFVPNVVCQTQDVDTARGLVAAGLGVAVVPSRIGSSYRGADVLPTVIEVPLGDPGAIREMALVWRRGAQLGPLAGAFKDHVVAGSGGVAQVT